MNKYEDNMTILVTSIKDTFKKDEALYSAATTGAGFAVGGRVSKLTKPVKVPSGSKDMSLETYTKQIMTWTEINKDVSEYVKFHDFIEELKKERT